MTADEVKTSPEYRLAAKLVRCQEALEIANAELRAAGKLGIIPDGIYPSVGESIPFYAKVGKVIETDRTAKGRS